MKASIKACIIGFLVGDICHLYATGTIDFDAVEIFIKYIVPITFGITTGLIAYIAFDDPDDSERR